MPGATNSECGGCNSGYSTLCNYSGARYLPLCSSGRIIAPSFDAVSGYQTGYCGSKANTSCCCDDQTGTGYGTMGCVYNNSCVCKPCKSVCPPICLPQQAIINDCTSCGSTPIVRGCGSGCC